MHRPIFYIQCRSIDESLCCAESARKIHTACFVLRLKFVCILGRPMTTSNYINVILLAAAESHIDKVL